MRPLLTLVVVVLGGILAWQWAGWPPEPADAPGASEGLGEGEQRPDVENALARLRPLGERSDYEVVVERPLFSPTRRPPTDEPAALEPEPEVIADRSLDRMDLSAVLITPEQSLAWVTDTGTRELRRLRPGDDVEGWAVRDILSDRLVLERQGETNTLVLRDYARQPPPPVRPRPPVRAPQRGQPPPQRPVPQAAIPRTPQDATPSTTTPPP